MGRTQVMGVVLVVTLPLLACDGQGTAPEHKILLSTQRVHGLELDLSIDPTTTVPGGSFTATLAITSRRDSVATLTSGCTRIARGVVHRAEDDEWMPFIGTTPGCYTALSAYRIEAGETVTWVWDVQATTREYLGDFQFETTPAPPGDYVFRVSPDVIWIDGQDARVPELEAAFQVK